MMTFTKAILEWYGNNARDLPWRRTRDPYRILISEVILQQTRIIQGTGYYHRFLSLFPDVRTLATAEEEEVLKAWQGLGYYSRARNLHQAAQEIVSRYGGIIPDRYEDLIRLKGIGEYTAAAILSIAFDQPYPVVDGNVLRFLSRYFGIHDRIDTPKGKRKILELMQSHMVNSRPGMFNQAVMEFGALRCIPANPDCERCPFKVNCVAYGNGMVGELPAKKASKKQRIRYFHYFVITWKDMSDLVYLYLRKRDENDIWKNLYDFPMIETDSESRAEELFMSYEWKKIMDDGIRFRLIRQSEPCKHILTHQIIFARFYIIEIEAERRPVLPFLLFRKDEIVKYPVPRLIEDFLLKNPL